MLGRAAVTMWWDIAPAAKAEWEDWHSHEHMPERLGIPGFLRGARWVAESDAPSYFVAYEVTPAQPYRVSLGGLPRITLPIMRLVSSGFTSSTI